MKACESTEEPFSQSEITGKGIFQRGTPKGAEVVAHVTRDKNCGTSGTKQFGRESWCAQRPRLPS